MDTKTNQIVAQIRLALCTGDTKKALQLGLGQGPLIENYVWHHLGVRWVTCGDFKVTAEPVPQALWKAVAVWGGNYTAPDLHQVGEIHWFDAVRFCNRLSEMEGLAPSYENFEWGIAHQK